MTEISYTVIVACAKVCAKVWTAHKCFLLTAKSLSILYLQFFTHFFSLPENRYFQAVLYTQHVQDLPTHVQLRGSVRFVSWGSSLWILRSTFDCCPLEATPFAILVSGLICGHLLPELPFLPLPVQCLLCHCLSCNLKTEYIFDDSGQRAQFQLLLSTVCVSKTTLAYPDVTLQTSDIEFCDEVTGEVSLWSCLTALCCRGCIYFFSL